jgi:general secretion pathway protein C
MTARLSAFFVWAVLAATAVFWALRLGNVSPVAPAHTVPVSGVSLPRGDLTRLFGAEPAPAAAAEAAVPDLSSRFRLIGVVAPRAAGGPGIALISVDGKPPRAFRAGAVIDGDLVLQAIEPRGVALGPRGAGSQARLELPPLPPPATGSLPPAGLVGGGAPQAPVGMPAAPPQPGMARPMAAAPMPAPPAPSSMPPPGEGAGTGQSH